MADESLTFRAFGEDVSAGRMLGDLGDKADDASTSIHGIGDESKSLDTRLDETKRHVEALLKEFEKTGDVTLFRDIRRDRSLISMIDSVKADLKKLEDDAQSSLSRGLSSIFSGLAATPLPLIAGITAAVAAAAPFVGAAIGGAVIGAVGLGGIVGGVFAGAQDPRVHDAGAQLGQNLLTGFTSAGRLFVAPLLDEMQAVQRVGDTFTSDLAAGFAKLAPLVRPLVAGLQGLAENLNLDKVFAASQPLVRALANELPEIGSALSDMFDSIADSGEGATEGLLALLHVTEDLIRFTGDFIGFLSDTYAWLVRNTAAAADFGLTLVAAFPAFTPLAGKLRDISDETHGLIDGMNKARSSGDDWNGTLATTASNADAAAQATKAFDDGIRTLFGQLMGLEEAQVQYNLDLIKAREELLKGTKTLAINSAEGLKNRQVLDGLINDIEKVREAHIANGTTVERANQLYEQQIRQLIALAVKLGFSRKEVELLAGALRDVPKKVAPETSTPGLAPALARAIALDKMFDRLDGRNVHSTVTTEFASYRAGERNPQGRAGGGQVAAGNTYWVGENGPEMVTFSASGRVIPAQQSAAIASAAGGGTTRVVFDVTGAEREMRQLIKKIVRVYGDGNVQKAVGES